MTWTRLFYVKNISKAFHYYVPNQQRQQPHISGRCQAMIAKQFRLHGVPWIYNPKIEKMNPRDKKPKMKKREKERGVKVAKIQKLLKENETKQIQFRQTRLNNRPLRGSDQLLARGLPSWIKPDLNEIPEYLKRQRLNKQQSDD